MVLLNIMEPGHKDTAIVQNEEIAVGIDLGTTNSLISIKNNDEIIIIPDENGNLIQPSIVAFDKNNKILCGNEAVEQKNSQRIFSIKRLMNENSLDKDGDFDYKIIKRANDPLKIAINNQEITPIEISSYLLLHLKNIAEKYLKRKVSKVVITVPAYFDEAARAATKNAAIIADMEVLRLINEPTAAAVSYGLDNKAKGTFLVFDLGGGTFDVSVLKLTKGVFKVIGVGGDSNMGGDDIDNILLNKIKKDCNIKLDNVEDVQNLRLIAKKIKEKLAKNDKIKQNFTISGQKYEFLITKSEFEGLILNFINKIIDITNNLIMELELDLDEINGVILVGGSTRLSLIREKLSDIFDKDKILTNLDPDKIVAMGAAIQARGLTHREESDNLLLDVVPLSLGIETMGGIVDKIIMRNSAIPTNYSKEFTTYADGQTGMEFHILQGERELVEDCRSLAKFKISNIPSLKAGVARVKVVFEIDADGLLTVSAQEESTKQVQKVEIKPAFGLNDIEIKEILIESAKNAKVDIKKRLLLEAKSESKRNILALMSALKEDGDLLQEKEKSQILKQIQSLEKVMKKDNKDDIDNESEKLEALAKNFAQKKMDKYIKESLVNQKIDDVV